MTNAQFFVLLGTMCIAAQMQRSHSLFIGYFFLTLSLLAPWIWP